MALLWIIVLGDFFYCGWDWVRYMRSASALAGGWNQARRAKLYAGAEAPAAAEMDDRRAALGTSLGRVIVHTLAFWILVAIAIGVGVSSLPSTPQ